jgi:hypothetical protein
MEQPQTVQVSEERMIRLGDFFYSSLKDKATVLHKIDVLGLFHDGENFVINTNEGAFCARAVLLGLGRGGTKWLQNSESSFHPTFTDDEYEFGVRLEFPSTIIDDCFEKGSSIKLAFDEFRTSIPVVQGTIETEEVNHVKISNGRQCSGTRNNLCSISFLKKFKHPAAHDQVYRISEIVNILCDGQLMREPASRLLAGNSAVSSLEEFKQLKVGLEKFFKTFPELITKTSVYGPEARLNAAKFNLTSSFETEFPNLYIIGDMSGKTSSFAQAACSGLLAAQNLIKKKV